MRYTDEFYLRERYAKTSVRTRFSVLVFMVVLVVSWLFTASVSLATCPKQAGNVVFGTKPLLYAGSWKFTVTPMDPEKASTPKEWNTLGVRYLFDRNEKNREGNLAKAMSLFAKAGLAGYAPASNNLGIMHLNGWGVRKDTETARKYFTEALKREYLPASNNLSVMTLKTLGAKAAEGSPKLGAEEAKSVLGRVVGGIRAAAERNYPPALNNLGTIYLKGIGGVKQDYAKAVTKFRHAIRFGYGPAFFNLGARYARGEGVPRDYEKAVELYEQAALKGIVNAQYSLGLMYSQGVGIEENLERSFVWFSLAKEGGYPVEKMVHEAAEKLLTMEQRNSAESCVKEMKKKLVTAGFGLKPSSLYDELAADPELYQFVGPPSVKAQATAWIDWQ